MNDSASLLPEIPGEVLAAAARPLPGTQPLDMAHWLLRDAAFASQMARRDSLLQEMPEAVLGRVQGAQAAIGELFDLVVGTVMRDPGYGAVDSGVIRPDGAEIDLYASGPLKTLGRLTQQDFCILEKPEGSDEHVMTAAVLCFPASWRLSEKLGRPLTAIHAPVQPYDSDIARRVQRLFDGIRAGQGLWRANALSYGTPELFLPDRASHGRDGAAAYLRSERQYLIRLPATRAVVFSIHTMVAPHP
ncbi:MAG: DUF3445 domain-containing protein [Pseudomonadota bacterium]